MSFRPTNLLLSGSRPNFRTTLGLRVNAGLRLSSMSREDFAIYVCALAFQVCQLPYSLEAVRGFYLDRYSTHTIFPIIMMCLPPTR